MQVSNLNYISLMKLSYLIIITFVLGLLSCNQSTPVKTVTFKVWGNCEKCKKTIESSVAIKGVNEKDWNIESKLMTVKFDTTIVSLNEVEQLIANAGYDNDLYYGDDYAYAKLESCCQYERKPFDLK